MGHDDKPALAAIDAVLSELKANAPGRGARLRVVLADAHIHFDVVSGDYRDLSERQLQSIATACVAELLGDKAPDQVVRCWLQPDLHHLLICSIGTREIESMVEVASRHGLSLASIQPDFCIQWNQLAEKMTDGTSVFASTNGNRAMIACVLRGTVTALSAGLCINDEYNIQTNPPTKHSLDARVDRLLASQGLNFSSISSFILVAPDISERGLDPRWTIFPPNQETS